MFTLIAQYLQPLSNSEPEEEEEDEDKEGGGGGGGGEGRKMRRREKKEKGGDEPSRHVFRVHYLLVFLSVYMNSAGNVPVEYPLAYSTGLTVIYKHFTL